MYPRESDQEDTYRSIPRCPSCGSTEYEEHDEDCDANDKED